MQPTLMPKKSLLSPSSAKRARMQILPFYLALSFIELRQSMTQCAATAEK